MYHSPAAQQEAGLEYKKVVKDVNALLDAFYESRLNSAVQLQQSYGRLWSVMYENHKAGGKRLRPYIMMLAYQGLGGEEYEKVLPIAAALELVHTCLLVHDDIIDRDYVRHGELNIAGRYRDTYQVANMSESQTTHYAHSAALLAGDLLLSGAYRLVNTSALTAEQKTAALELIDNAIFTVGAGELLDTEAAFMPGKGIDSLKIARLKTGRYSFAVPMVMGAMLARGDESVVPDLIESGEAIGIAFQLADDLLGMFGDQRVTGKSTKNDLLEGKRTYLIELALQMSSPKERALIRKVLGNANATEPDIIAVKNILVSCGAKADTEHMIREQHSAAAQSIQQVPFSDSAIRSLLQLFDTLAWRKV